MSEYDITVIIPGLNPDKWDQIYSEIEESCYDRYTFEVIFVGPNPPDTENGLDWDDDRAWILEFGSPSRCVQHATTFARGRYVTWGPEDGKYQEEALANAISYFDNHLDDDSGMVIRYYEKDMDPNAPLPPQPPVWPNVWSAEYHRDLHMPGVPANSYWHGCWMYKTDFYREIGGLDCRFEHVNMNCNDLAFRVQAAGKKMGTSPDFVIHLDNTSSDNPTQTPIESAFHENDLPLFKEIYSQPNAAKNRFKIDYDNWKLAEERWSRRFGNEE
jgi:hypothetical protein